MNADDETTGSPLNAARVDAPLLRFTREAMATVFEVVAIDEEPAQAQIAAAAAFDLIEQIEDQISFFIPSSEVSQINRLAAGESLRVGAAAFDCIRLAKQVHSDTQGAFDITAGALLTDRRPWDEEAEFGKGRIPKPKDGPVHVGAELVALNDDLRAVAVLTDHVAVDLGGLGKGYALDQAGLVLADYGMEPAVVSSGQSTMLPLGVPAGATGWPMRLLDPRNERDVLAQFVLGDAAVSASANSDQPHIIDPEDGSAAGHWLGAWAIAPSAAWADALSTAFMVMEAAQVESYCREHPGVCAILVSEDAGRPALWTFGPTDSFQFQRV